MRPTASSRHAALGLIFLGGMLGTLARYFLTQGLPLTQSSSLLVINILGCVALGCVTTYYSRGSVADQRMKFLAGTGFCGAFTSYSTLATILSGAILSNLAAWAALYIALSLAGGLVGIVAGLSLGRYMRTGSWTSDSEGSR